MSISEQVRENRPPYVIFERRAVEDRQATLQAGRFVSKDVDFAIVTPIGSKDRIPREVQDWFKMLDQQAREQRIPPEWPLQYRKAYEAWMRGEDTPVQGTPIKGWPLLTPAQQANVIGANIRTVEDLAQANDEARHRIGMGANEMVAKAFSWLKTASERGTVVQENVALHARVQALEEQIKNLQDVNSALRTENAMLVTAQGAHREAA